MCVYVSMSTTNPGGRIWFAHTVENGLQDRREDGGIGEGEHGVHRVRMCARGSRTSFPRPRTTSWAGSWLYSDRGHERVSMGMEGMTQTG